MAGDEDAAEKSFDATPKKLEDARKKGEIPKSVDLNTSAAYLGFILAVTVLGISSLDTLGMAARQLIAQSDEISQQVFEGGGAIFFGAISQEILIGLIPLFGLPALAVLGALFAQQAIVFVPSKIAPKLNRISLISGAKNKFGPSGLFEFAKSAAKLVLVCGLLCWFAIGKIDEILVASMTTPALMAIQISTLLIEFLTVVFVMSLIIGGIDYLWQVSEHLRKNRMSRQEIQDEAKQSEGDPHLKQSRRQRGYDIAMNQMLSDVPDADVVIVNPTHYAVALKWDRTGGQAPICVAKGVDEIAAKIREIATTSAIPIHSDPPTARALHATVEIGQEIQRDHYRAVAAAIRFAEALRKKARRK